MKQLILICLLFQSFSSFSQYDWPPTGEENVDYFLNAKEKADGIHYRTYDDGSIFYAGTFEKGLPKPNTEFWYYYEDPRGQPMTLHKISNDPKEIEAVNYYPSGKIMSTGFYSNKKKTGLWTFYTEDGSIKSTEEYLNDQLSGQTMIYYENGKLYKLESYTAGIKDGKWEEYFEHGGKKAEGSFLKGKRNGDITYYNSNGRFDVTGSYKNGLKNGTWVKYHSDGRTEISTLYENDQKIKERKENGTFMEYYNNGIPKSEHEYVNSKKNGPFTTWYDKGDWVREPMQNDGTGALSYTEKLKGTQVESEGDYVDGMLEGEVIYYSETGRIVKIETYSEGVLIDTEEK